MFDFAISQNYRRKPTRRTFASWALSCLAHGFFLLMLIQFPQLLQGGMYHRFRPMTILASILGSAVPDDKDKDDEEWRTVAVLRGPMIAPSAATLKKYLRDWDKKEPGPPPVSVRWGDEQRAAFENVPPMPKIRQEPKPQQVLPPPNSGAAAQASAGNSPDGSGSSIVRVEPEGGKRGTLNLPPPGPDPKTEVAGNKAPTAIPDGIRPPPAIPPSKDAVKVFEDEQKALVSPESGFFDTKGFPLGEYANLIKERIKGKWYIPSNLRNSQGHTTVVFYIGKDGRFTDARIVSSSGSKSLDLAALKAVIDSNPFPPLPNGFPGDRVGAKFVLSYNEP